MSGWGSVYRGGRLAERGCKSISCGGVYTPRELRTAAHQKMSPQSAGRNSRPPTLLPYLSWKGSNIVT